MLDMPDPKVSRTTAPNATDAAHDTLPERLLAAAKPLWARRYGLAGVIAAIALAWGFGPNLLLGQQVTVDKAVRADFVQSVVVSGHVEAPYRVNIGSQITGVVADVPVTEGQLVKAGEPLIQLDDREARAAVVQIEGVVAQAEARLRQMQELTLPAARETLAQAKATQTNAQQAFGRAQKLASNGYGTRAALDEATKALDIARAQVRNAEFQVYTNRPGGSDYVMVETQLAQARANLASAQSRLTYTVIRAPREGVLISRDVERGNVVQPTAVLMKLSPTGETQLVVQIDEKNLGLIAIGQTAIASADAYAKQTFPAEVVFVNPAIDLQRASVEVKLQVKDPPAYLRQDMTVSVDIKTAQHPNALIIPTTVVRGIGTPKPWVMAVKSRRTVRQDVTLGLQSAGRSEVLAGLDEGALVVPATTAIKEGARVRASIAAQRAP